MIDNAPEIEGSLNERFEPGVYIAPLAARATAFEIVGERGIRLHTPAGPFDGNFDTAYGPVRQAIIDGGQLYVFEVALPQEEDEAKAAEILKAEAEKRVSAYIVGPVPRD
ncbi:hypothetical protein AX289_23095 [Methylorubrum populi]|nr:hypothetical protein AX289_23095 [Methylorubrum populi]